MKKNSILNLIMVIISFSLFFIIFELFLYIDNHSADYKKFIYKINNINYTFNDNPIDYLNDKNQEKIIFLGDSYTQAVCCAPKKKDFVNVIKTRLGADYKPSIYNFGSGGRGPADYLNIYNYLKQKNLTRVIVVMTYNDIKIGISDCLTFKELSKNGYPKIKMCDFVLETKVDTRNDTILKRIDNILERTRIWQFIRNRLANVSFLKKYYGRSDFAISLQNPQSEQFITFLNILKQLQTDAQKNGIMINFVNFPDVYHLSEELVSHKAVQVFIDELKAEDIIMHDSWEYFMEHKDSNDMSWSFTDFHPNYKAHEIMANFILEKIL